MISGNRNEKDGEMERMHYLWLSVLRCEQRVMISTIKKRASFYFSTFLLVCCYVFLSLPNSISHLFSLSTPSYALEFLSP